MAYLSHVLDAGCFGQLKIIVNYSLKQLTTGDPERKINGGDYSLMLNIRNCLLLSLEASSGWSRAAAHSSSYWIGTSLRKLVTFLSKTLFGNAEVITFKSHCSKIALDVILYDVTHNAPRQSFSTGWSADRGRFAFIFLPVRQNIFPILYLNYYIFKALSLELKQQLMANLAHSRSVICSIMAYKESDRKGRAKTEEASHVCCQPTQNLMKFDG